MTMIFGRELELGRSDMQFIIYNKDTPLMRVFWDKAQAKSEWVSNFRHPNIFPYMYPDCITISAIAKFCESRLPPRSRVNIDELLRRKYKLKTYQPIQMCKVTRGISHSDDLWLLFKGEEQVPYASITVRQQ